MKNMVKSFGIIAIAAVIGFAFAACDTGGGPGNNDPGYQGGQNQPTVTGVTVTPANVEVFIGTEQQFTATVTGTNNPQQTVTWSVEGNQHSGTTISSAGLLSVHTDEDLGTITVRARSTLNTAISGTTTVTVTNIPPVRPTDYILPTGLTAVYGQTLADVSLTAHANWEWDTPADLVGAVGPQTHSATYRRLGNFLPVTTGITVTVTPAPTVTSVTVSPSTATVNRGGSQNFTATVTGANNPPLTVNWTVEGGVAGTSINASGVLTVAAGETATSLTIRATSTFNTDISGTAAVTVPQPTVTSVTVSPSTATVNRGGNQTFIATVTGANNPPLTVNWTVEGGGAGTSINASGLLTVAAGETAPSLTIRATSTFNSAVSGTAIVVAVVPIDMVRINPGSVGPNHGTNATITITDGFYIGRHPVTQHQWQEVMTGNPNGISATPSWFRAGGNGASMVAGLNTANFPVERVSWFDALVFANRLSIQRGRTPVYSINGSTNPNDWGAAPTGSGHSNFAAWNAVIIVSGDGYRLPTSEQWEFAARAGTTADFHNGVNWVSEAITAPLVAPIAWINHNSGSRTHHVGTRLPNAWGLHDMHGNVWEWCWDDVFAHRVLRGGSWSSTAGIAGSSYWGSISPWYSWHGWGLRLVRP